MASQLLLCAGVAVLALLLWVYKVNLAMETTPPDGLRLTPTRWTAEQVKEVFSRLEKNPIDWRSHLPPKLERRYIIVGGSGLVGGQIAIQLIARGHPPEAIRIIDFRTPGRDDMASGPVSQVDFAQADITSEPATLAAFTRPWPKSVASLPLTVFHTAAVIRPAERSLLVYDRVGKINFGGSVNVLASAKKVGAEVFIITSSCAISSLRIQWFNAPWRRWPTGFLQRLDESDFSKPLRPLGEFISNYAICKARAERIVCDANEIPEDPLQKGGFRTGAIRPGNAIYGHRDDYMVGSTIKAGSFPTFTAPYVQNWAHAANVAVAHLQYEAALLSPHAHKVAARPFFVTDPGPPPLFRDYYTLAQTVCITPFHVSYPPPVLLLFAAHLIEKYCLLIWNFPFLQRWLTEPKEPLYLLQPACFNAASNVLIDDSVARKSLEDGGLGYRGIYETLEGLCLQIGDWNRYVKSSKAAGGDAGGQVREGKGIIGDVLEVGVEPVIR